MENEKKYTIKHWAEDDRPVEKLLSLGAQNLSNSELLAILIYTGTPSKSAVDVAKQVLKACGDDISAIGKLSVKDLCKIDGIGPKKAVRILAAIEIGKRKQSSTVKKEIIQSSKQAVQYFKAEYEDLPNEVFAIMFLNKANKVVQIQIMSTGGIDRTSVDVRIILMRAIELGAINIIACHNHPSGNLKPSNDDLEITKKLKEAAKVLDICLLDHLIVSKEGYFSFADENLL